MYRGDGRANETAEETERRRSEDRLRIIAIRNNITAEETEQRRSEDRLRTIVSRNNMTAEETEELRSDDQLQDEIMNRLKLGSSDKRQIVYEL
ncbi:hypothetical protein AVEN_46291-1 [Araneus ventricosus]|uniref:Uncharacterized protein n=1 Tax=Araneus ventricosus TaxID=182803 RepID=A0A4Y2MRQ6_ARAVE|nr:hypothetical protein AVEN_46291-1 [Araneus ventricosus]